MLLDSIAAQWLPLSSLTRNVASNRCKCAPYTLGYPFTDLNNAPLSGMAGAITAALFLKKFTKSHNMFLHFDIFGWNTKSKPGKTYGGLMQGVRSLGTAIEEKFFN